MVATLDVRDFYPSIDCERVERVLFDVGFDREALRIILALTTLRGAVPQGAPTSCILANLAFGSVDSMFLAMCRARGLYFTRFIDDIAVSGSERFERLRAEFVGAIEREGFSVAPEKVRFMGREERQVVTGLVVNDVLRPGAEYRRLVKKVARLVQQRDAWWVADKLGWRISRVKAALTSRVGFVAGMDPGWGRDVKGLLCGVVWRERAMLSGDRIESQLERGMTACEAEIIEAVAEQWS